jgi:hypothetical protein
MKKKEILYELCYRSRMLGEARVYYRNDSSNFPRIRKNGTSMTPTAKMVRDCEKKMRDIEMKAVEKGLLKKFGTLMTYSEWAD